MSDQRREAVRAAIDRVMIGTIYYTADDLTDAALAAIDAAEPTDAEVEAAAEAMWFFDHEWDATVNGTKPSDWDMTAYQEQARAALIAAGKART
jgi:hypothetical protein